MRVAALLREAWLGTISGASRAPILFLLYLVIAGCLISAEVAIVKQHIDLADQYQHSGATITTIELHEAIDGDACDALKSVPQIRASGAIRNEESELQLVALPGAPVPKYDVSSGLAGVLGVTQLFGEGVLVSHDIAESLGVRDGSTLMTDAGDMKIAARYAYPNDGRRTGFGYAVLSPTPNGHAFDECWVDAWPQIENVRSLLLSVVLPQVVDEPSRINPVITTLNQQLGASFSGSTAFAERVSRFAPHVMALVSVALGSVAFWMRRLSLASALHNGMKRRDLVTLGVWETLIWCVPATVLSMCIAIGSTSQLVTADMMPLVQSSFVIPLIGLVGCVSGATITLVAVRERSFFRYFKTR